MKVRNRLNWYKIWIRCALLALIASVTIFLVMLQIERRALEGCEKKAAWVARREIPKGLVLDDENWQEYLEQRQVDAQLVSDAVPSDTGYWEGVTPVFSIEKGTLVTRGMFESIDSVLAGMEEPVVVGFKAEDLYQVAGGVLRPGDRIHIYLLGVDGVMRQLRDNVYVQQTFDAHGNPVEPGDDVTAVYRLNVYMEKEDVKEFYGDLSIGTLRVVKIFG